MTTHATAAVLTAVNRPFELLAVELEDPRSDEVLVRIEACGVCHTDIEAMQMLAPPVVLGHEGVGVVEKVGCDVSTVSVGDRVAVSYPRCGHCAQCAADRPFQCVRGLELSFAGCRADGSMPVRLDGRPIASAFFQQSAFASHALTLARDVVKIPAGFPSVLAGSLPCGVQTGAGSIIHSLAVRAGESVAVFGVGAVGLSGIMAARLLGAKTIIAVDVNAARLNIAGELGATHIVNAVTDDVVTSLKVASGGGVDATLDTSGRDSALQQAIAAMAHGGRLGIVTVPEWGHDYRLRIQPLFERCGSLISIIQGSSVPAQFLPYLIEQYNCGNFPLDRLVSTYRFDEINRAFEDARAGNAIKPVLVMS